MSVDPKRYPVLVVDDEQDNLDAFRFNFRKTLDLHTANSGAEALAMLGEVDVAVIVTDQRMPKMTGLEMLPKVKEIRPEVPVIMITAYGDPDTKRRAMENGASGLLTKPIDFSLLREEIDSRLAAAN